VILLFAPAAASARAPVPRIDARVAGAFQMQARVNEAVNVRGEHRGMHLRREWTITPGGCVGSVCARLSVRRQRSAGMQETLTLKRTGVGAYAGDSSFYAPLRCRGRTYRHGMRVPYRITLTIVGAETVQAIMFARRIAATYTNLRRVDTTPCSLAPSHDAALYTGAALSPLPTPPAVSVTATVDEATATAAFTSVATPAIDGAPIISRQWNFGDPASGAADGSIETYPTHIFSAAGSYAVTLTVTDANGLTATATQEVQI
jgi:hypothetical protein